MSIGLKVHLISFCLGSQEAYNKVDRRNRLQNARKCSRELNLTDVMHRHLEGSDPLVIYHMKFPRKKQTPPTPEMAALLEPVEPESNGDNVEKDASSNSDTDSDSDFEP